MSRSFPGACLLGLVLLMALSGCGGGSGPRPAPVETAAPGMLEGTAVKGGFLAGARVNVFRVVGGARGSLLTTGQIGDSSGFSVVVSDTAYSGPVVIEVDGAFQDEATGQVQSTGGTPLRCALPSLSAGGTLTGVVVSPLTHLAASLAEGRGGLTTTAIQLALDELGARFGVTDPAGDAPLQASQPATDQTTTAVNHGLFLFGLSEEARQRGVSTMDLVEATARDAADGVLDGLDRGMPFSIPSTSGTTVSYDSTVLGSELSRSIAAFLATTRNGTGLTASDPPVTSLTARVVQEGLRITPSIGVAPLRVQAGQRVTLDARGTEVPEGVRASYLWGVTLGSESLVVQDHTKPLASFISATPGTHRVTLLVSDSLGAVPPATATTTVQVDSPAGVLSIVSITTTPVVDPGDTFLATLQVKNTGGTKVVSMTASLDFSTSGFAATPRTSNPVEVVPGATARLLFDVTSTSTAPQGLVTISAAVQASDAISGAPTSDTTPSLGLFVFVQGGARLTIAQAQGIPTTVTQGQTFDLTLPVTNPGLETALIELVSLVYDEGRLVAIPTNSTTSIAPGDTFDFTYRTLISNGAPAGVHAASVRAQARGALTGAPMSSGNVQVGQTTVRSRALLQATTLTASPQTLTQGQTLTVTLSLINEGNADANVTSVGFGFTTSALADTPDTSLQSISPGMGITRTVNFDTAAVPPGTYSVNAIVAATSPDTGVAVPFTDVVPSPSFVVQATTKRKSPSSWAAAAGRVVPSGVAARGWPRAIVDMMNNRVLLFDSADPSELPRVLGQDELTGTAPGTTASRLRSPGGVALAGGRLVLADSGNHRVLLWNDVNKVSNGAAADLVLGQSDFAGGQANRGSPRPGADTLSNPSDVAVLGDRLFVADAGNNRVLVYEGLSRLTAGARAGAVIGQPDFQTRRAGEAPSPAAAGGGRGLSLPQALAVSGTLLVVADTGHDRILGWDVPRSGATPAAEPRFVLGGEGVELNAPAGVDLWDGRLFISDSLNGRLVVYDEVERLASGASPDQETDGALLELPMALSAFSRDEVFVADQGREAVVRVRVGD